MDTTRPRNVEAEPYSFEFTPAKCALLIVPEDCVGSCFPEFQEMGLKMIKAQGGIFGWVSHSDKVLAAFQ